LAFRVGLGQSILNLMFAHKQPAVALCGPLRLPRVRAMRHGLARFVEGSLQVQTRLQFLSTWACLVCSTASHSADIGVTVVGLKSADGFLGCALFAQALAERFPLDLSQAVIQRAPARVGSMRCEFVGLPAGRYAVSASHDVNGNGKPDRNFVGLPTEPWAVSNNVRPTLRAPRFAEAALTLTEGESMQIELRLAD
jgi:uncharacterized protein (DUF2141 family)